MRTYRQIGIDAALVVTLVSSGCGPGGSNSDTDTSDATGDGSGEAGEGSGDGGVCSPWDNEAVSEIGPSFEFRAPAAGPVFLAPPVGCQPDLFEVRGQIDGADGHYPGDFCLTCEAAMAGECGCPLGCPVSPIIKIEAGGTYRVDAPGGLYVEDEIPAQCVDASLGCGPGSCEVIRSYREGSYTLGVRRIPFPLTCERDPAQCECAVDETNPDGWCTLQVFDEGLGTSTELQMNFSWPTDGPVEMQFD